MTVEVGPSGGQGLLRDPGNGFLANFIQRPLERWRRADGRDLIEDSILQAFPGIQGRHYFAIFVLASVTLSYQILITRFFSVMLYYHFAFAAISLAMLGLTRGAMEVYNKPVRYAPERVGGGIRPPCIVVRDHRRRRNDRLPVRAAGDSRRISCWWRWRSPTVAFVRPFTESGVCITLAADPPAL